MNAAKPGPIATIEALSAPELRGNWATAFGRPPPSHASDTYLRMGLSYEAQTKAGQNFSKVTRRKLLALAEQIEDGQGSKSLPSPRLKAGVKLQRDWNGETHEVTVLDKGFKYRRIQYRSLSAIAREITGTRWSGPAFFGLKGGKRKEQSRAA